MKTFPELLTELGIDYAPAGASQHVREGWIGLVCPFCDGGIGNFGLGYNLDSGALNCWKCGAHRTGETLAAITGRDLRECIELVTGLGTPRVIRPERRRGQLKRPRGMVNGLDRPQREYLRSRNFVPERLEKLWHLGSINEAGGPMAWSVFIPYELGGTVVSWTTRAIGANATRRYRAAPPDMEAMHHKELLYGEDYVRHAVIVHEGPADVWATGPGAVAVGGLGVTAAQTARIARYPVRAIAFDAEPVARTRARALVDSLTPFPGVTHLVELDAHDAATASARELRQLRRSFLG